MGVEAGYHHQSLHQHLLDLPQPPLHYVKHGTSCALSRHPQNILKDQRNISSQSHKMMLSTMYVLSPDKYTYCGVQKTLICLGR